MSDEEGGAEAYCVESGAPVRLGAGDRCIHHGAADTPCYAAVRAEAERDAARAELDNLRNRVNTLAERKSHCSRDECHRLRTDLRALVRGSDDEA